MSLEKYSSPSLEVKILGFAPRKDFVIDTGALLIHALGAFQNGRYVSQACDFLHEKNKERVAKELFTLVDRVFMTSRLIFVTPHALTEFFALLEGRMDIKGTKFLEFFRFYKEALLHVSDAQVPKDMLIESETLPRFGIADTAAIIAADLKNSIIITTDSRLVQWCRSQDYAALHIYYDIYLNP